eukprot:CAMPEP_0171308548 /NCGR_PEP_ID=MMETSP0816-20121228/18661_1 /TAXON_ID=420281 /ORGANISM="Proboscia inermis, Strain CCAP1064/1" /LENGTH=249 /DNA_ID=CAMNT_0011791493 /DNA_START=215 /DNA_END=964 /DNA_ORIENTATION=+
MDVLNILTEYKRLGCLKSITCMDFPPEALKLATSNGFVLDSNQVIGNVLDQRPVHELIPYHTANVPDCRLQLSSPLMGGILTDEYIDRERRGIVSELDYGSVSKQRHWEMVQQWARGPPGRNSIPAARNFFSSRILQTLADIGYKYQVPVSSVALRWALQSGSPNELSGVVLSTRVGVERPTANGWIDTERSRELRNLFRFELDDDDTSRIYEAYLEGELPKLVSSDDYLLEEDDPFFSVDLSDTRLWL